MLVNSFRSKREVFGAVIAVIGGIAVVTREINAPITYDESAESKLIAFGVSR